MIKILKTIFNYLKPIWSGEDGKPSLRAIAAIVLTYKLIENVDYAIQKWEQGRSLGEASSIFFTLAGLIAALLGITAWSNMTAKKIDNEAIISPDTIVTVNKAETIVANGKTPNTTQTDSHTETTSTSTPVVEKGDI